MAMPRQDELQEIDGLREHTMSEALPILDDIAKHTKIARRAVGMDPVDTFTLSQEIIELAILSQRLAERIATMGYVARSAQEFYERTREAWKVKLVKGYTRTDKAGGKKEIPGVAAGVADSMKLEYAHDSFSVHNNCQYSMDSLKFARNATDKTIDTIRTKISYEKTDRRNS